MQTPKWALVVALATVGLTPTTLAARADAAPRHQAPPVLQRLCTKTFTLAMFRRAVDVDYAATRPVPRGAQSALTRMLACQREAVDMIRARSIWEAAKGAWERRRALPAFQQSLVSWYDDAGTHCCGVYATIGVADCGSGGGPCYPQGTQIEFCEPFDRARCVIATVDDHGPYVPGRWFDLNQNTAAAIGFDGLGDVLWRVVN